MRTRFVVALALVIGILASLAAPVAAHESYEVRPGDTLSHIAARFGVSMQSLVEENDLDNPNRIRVGQSLQIPHGSTATTASVPTTTAAESPAPVTTYTVRPGDTLGEIALRLGVGMQVIAEANGIRDPHRIRVGQRLRVPGADAPAVAEKADSITPTAATGDYPHLIPRIVNDEERRALIPIFERWANANAVPVDLLMAIAWHESGWNNRVVSHKGAVGIGQIMPRTGEWIASDLIGEPGLRSTVPEDNIRMSARYVRWLIDYLGNETLALAGYFQGPGAVRAGRMYESTQHYVASVQANRRFFVTG